MKRTGKGHENDEHGSLCCPSTGKRTLNAILNHDNDCSSSMGHLGLGSNGL